jgi:hypothetical protein
MGTMLKEKKKTNNLYSNIFVVQAIVFSVFIPKTRNMSTTVQLLCCHSVQIRIRGLLRENSSLKAASDAPLDQSNQTYI